MINALRAARLVFVLVAVTAGCSAVTPRSPVQDLEEKALLALDEEWTEKEISTRLGKPQNEVVNTDGTVRWIYEGTTSSGTSKTISLILRGKELVSFEFE